MSILQKLLQIANQLIKYEDYNLPELDALEKAAKTIGKSWSGSWIGYHSRAYYVGFQPPPDGAVFLQDRVHIAARGGNWKEYDFHEVVQFIHQKAGNLSADLPAVCKEATEAFEQAKVSALSLVYANYDVESNKFMADLVTQIKGFTLLPESYFIESQRPSGQIMSRDTRVAEQGLVTPPHIAVLSKVYAAQAHLRSCKALKEQIVILANHIQNLEQNTMQKGKLGNSTSARIGNKIFIGHGHSPAWREFKDFIVDRLELNWDEFNRVSSAGIPNTERLGQMLDQACMAFLVMTAEDEDAEGKLHARENVIHEAGLFQDRLGFERAIILLEEGCEEFSNIEGLGQIRFPKGNISAIFEEVRRVLEREGII